jgi:uncharacterized protein (DUF58 family)
MRWRRNVDLTDLKTFDLVALCVLGMLIVGLITQHVIPYAAAGILTAHLILLKRFDQAVLKQFKLENPTQRIRLFPEEESSFTIHLENKLRLPLINGRITFRIGHPVTVPEEQNVTEKEDHHTVTIPASILPKKEVAIRVPVKANHRGVAKISRFTFQYMHPFAFTEDSIRLDGGYDTELIVYPALRKVEGVESVFHMHPGSARLRHSPFEDIQDPVGTRDYTYSDSFQRMNWKASARRQQLQTNVYQYVADRSFVFLINLKTDLEAGAAEAMEQLLSYAAYLCQYATEQGQPYELMANLLRPGSIPFLYQHEGSGNTQLMKSLELLARIPRHAMSQPFEHLLYHLQKTQQLPKTIIVLGEIPAEAEKQVKRLKQLGHHLFYVENQDAAGVIMRLETERIA